MPTLTYDFAVGPGIAWSDGAYPGRYEIQALGELPRYYNPATVLYAIRFTFRLSDNQIDTGGVVVQFYPMGNFITHQQFPGGGYYAPAVNSFVYEGIGVAFGDTDIHDGYLLNNYRNTSSMLGTDYDQSLAIVAHLVAVNSDYTAPPPIIIATLMISYDFYYSGYFTNGSDSVNFNSLSQAMRTVINTIPVADHLYEAMPGDDFVTLPDIANYALTGAVTWNPNHTFFAGSGADNITGGDGNDRIDGGAGNDTLNGKSGADWLIGGYGNDTYVVDQQGDILFENVNEGIDSVTASTGFYLYANVENLTAAVGAGNIFGVGNELANVINGNEGENLLIAGAGNDEVYGGGARDSIFGQDGSDRLFGDSGIDYIVAGSGNDTVNGGADADEIYGQEGDDALTGGSSFDTDILVGGDGDDTIYGNSGQGDYDLMYGNIGNDIFYVDTPNDLVFEQPGEGNDTVYAGINGAGYYLYANIENLVLTNNTPFGVGNELDNRLTGNAIGNFLLGGVGNDTLNGMGGNDVLFGETGNDVFLFGVGTGGDVIGDFTRGQDRINLSAFGLTFDQAQLKFVQNGGDGAIILGNGDFIVLNGVVMSQLTGDDFIFA